MKNIKIENKEIKIPDDCFLYEKTTKNACNNNMIIHIIYHDFTDILKKHLGDIFEKAYVLIKEDIYLDEIDTIEDIESLEEFIVRSKEDFLNSIKTESIYFDLEQYNIRIIFKNGKKLSLGNSFSLRK